MSDDELRIRRLGGPARVAALLQYSKRGGTQRVSNWIDRGIPPRVKVERPDLFLVPLDQLPPLDEPPAAPAGEGA